MNNQALLQARYSGFCNTALLWQGDAIRQLQQLDIHDYQATFLRKLERPLRLGQLAERFVFNQLDALKDFEILAENLQIQDQKRTVGELDALLLKGSQPIHLEMVYKFYLYDATLGLTETQKWIGPNRRDSLEEKLDKLQKQQLPLLHSEFCRPILEKLNLKPTQFQQKVLFKAQLFVPYQNESGFDSLNPGCVKGFYLYPNQLREFTDSKFHIPPKMDWFLEPDTFVDWQTFESFKKNSNSFLEQQKSPMFWIKKPNGELLKAFLVWW
ncbi:DUF1853 family protein [Subsaximicrobium wynnwilliamsii]|uniref:DUF1853 family protein n=1 Tax=Subsaximicrobium wynnwilliamsii TaxID=291179 RepID=A0A5C6ZH45_9FLAO|nr:DUF1853 family protein [Subsaximicrobium wynnwilliamsii]TXD84044.1 DUF1853 family protein [Subsaximicrobium wynnwilliamsii]TXD88998.1 DUF1853 family protein [Subsaximicrobium wynnwilliamsii]TXE03756.1 DUF1853 family protein [Subsaximicrobium wynnwilliamsii]